MLTPTVTGNFIEHEIALTNEQITRNGDGWVKRMSTDIRYEVTDEACKIYPDRQVSVRYWESHENHSDLSVIYYVSAIVALVNWDDAAVGDCCWYVGRFAPLAEIITRAGKIYRRKLYQVDGLTHYDLWKRVE